MQIFKYYANYSCSANSHNKIRVGIHIGLFVHIYIQIYTCLYNICNQLVSELQMTISKSIIFACPCICTRFFFLPRRVRCTCMTYFNSAEVIMSHFNTVTVNTVTRVSMIYLLFIFRRFSMTAFYKQIYTAYFSTSLMFNVYQMSGIQTTYDIFEKDPVYILSIYMRSVKLPSKLCVLSLNLNLFHIC